MYSYKHCRTTQLFTTEMQSATSPVSCHVSARGFSSATAFVYSDLNMYLWDRFFFSYFSYRQLMDKWRGELRYRKLLDTPCWSWNLCYFNYNIIYFLCRCFVWGEELGWFFLNQKLFHFLVLASAFYENKTTAKHSSLWRWAPFPNTLRCLGALKVFIRGWWNILLWAVL